MKLFLKDINDDEEIEDYQFKVIVIGDGSCGKTSLIQRLTNDTFKLRYLQTIGVDWFKKTIEIEGKARCTLQIWDIGGQQIESKLLPSYIFGSDAIVLVYDITNYESYKNLVEWFLLVKRVFPRRVPLIAVIGNKSDLEHMRMIRESVVENWTRDMRFLSFVASAKTGDNVNFSFVKIVSKLTGISIPKAQKENKKVVKAEVVDYPNKNVEEIKPKKKKSKCKIQ